MEAETESEIQTIQEEMDAYQEILDDGQEETGAQMDSLASWINVNQENLKAKMDIHQKKMEATIHSIRLELERPPNIRWKTSCRVSTKRCWASTTDGEDF
jgi:hypothetical protein